MTSDAAEIINRVIQNLVSENGDDNEEYSYQRYSPDDYIVNLVSDWVRKMLTPNRGNVFDDNSAGISNIILNELKNYEDLKQRNSALAKALGACECWGEDPNCFSCLGEGSPGWNIPDKNLFLVFVVPALKAMKYNNENRLKKRNEASLQLPGIE